MKQIVIATRNKGKIREFKTMLQRDRITVISLNDLNEPILDIEETGETFYDNAKIKAETVSSMINKPVIADDSGLIIDALNGRPGIYSARYAGKPINDVKNYEKVLNEMTGIEQVDRAARFVAVLALARPGYETLYFKGYCEGEIAFEPKGDFGFGYDPIFIPKGFNVTMAQLTEEEKNKISHRYDALNKLRQWIQTNEI